MSGTDAVDAIRQQIERKYSEALQALETLKAYFADTQPARLQEPNGTAPRSISVPLPPAQTETTVTTVDRVLQAIATDFKTVEQLVGELGLPEHSIRGALYSKFVQSRIAKKRINGIVAFRRRISTDAAVRRPKGEGSVANLVRDHLAKHPEGQTSGQIHAAVAGKVQSMGGSMPAIGAALYNMKKRGAAIHNEATGMYTLAKAKNPTPAQ